MVVDIEVSNLELTADGTRLQRLDPAVDALVVFHFPSQHIAERAFWEAESTSEPATPPPVAALASGPTRLAFMLAPGQDSVAFNPEALLDWEALVPSLPGNALPVDAVTGPAPGAPSLTQTSIEFPYRLFLSPDASATWTHRRAAFTSGNRTEIWHSRLTPPPGRPATPVRAVGRRDVPDRVRTSLSTRDLADLVTLSGDFSIHPKSWTDLGMSQYLWSKMMRDTGLKGRRFPPRPIEADQFLITSLGATARLHGKWDYPPDGLQDLLARVGMPTPSLEQFEHIAGQGRDQYVRVVRRGVTHTGHRASLVKVTERRFEPRQVRVVDTPGGTVGVFGSTAYLRQYYQVVVQEPLKYYDELAGGYTHGGREMPFRSLRFTTLVSPKLDLNPSPDVIEANALIPYQLMNPRPTDDRPRRQWDLDFQAHVQRLVEQSFQVPFWVRASGTDFVFGVVGTDWEGHSVTFDTPILFIPYEAIGRTDADKAVKTTAVFIKFNEDLQAGRARRPMANQVMAIANPAGSEPGSTRVPVETVTFELKPLPANPNPPLPPTYLATWVLQMRSAEVHLDPVEQLTGRHDATTVALAQEYLIAGLGAANISGAFANLVTDPDLLPAPLTVKFAGPQGGGVARPDSTVEVLSSRVGTMGKAFTGIDPPDLTALFGKAKLFGFVNLVDILAPIADLSPADFSVADLDENALTALLADHGARLRVPVLRTRRLTGPDGIVHAVESRFVWKPELKTSGILELSSAELVLDVRTVAPLDGSPAQSEVRGELRSFSLRFFGVLEVTVDRLAFVALPGHKPDVTAEGCRLQFQGALTFVNTLRNILPDDGFSDPPSVEVTSEGISVGYTLGVPSVGVGILSIENLSLSAGLAVPFNDQPANVRFALSERHHPFIVTVALFGGGGFFALTVSARGVEQIEAAIEFGGNVAINLGVASGGVYIMAGIYFAKTPTDVTLTGYLRCGGYLSVLGLISISVEFYLAFSYRKSNGRSEVYGQASLSVTVKLACFSKTVTLSVERSFEGAPGDPSFDDTIDPAAWEQYCLAFAPAHA